MLKCIFVQETKKVQTQQRKKKNVQLSSNVDLYIFLKY